MKSWTIALSLLAILALGAGPARPANYTCYPTGEPFSTCTTDFAQKIESEVLAYGGATTGSVRRREGAFKFDVASVPATTITRIEFHFHANAATHPHWSITPVTSDPRPALADSLWADVNAEAFSGYYCYSMEPGGYPPGWKVKVLGGAAEADLTAIVTGAQEWFALGVVDRDGLGSYFLEIDGYTMANPPYLVVTDDPPPPNDSCAGAEAIPGVPGLYTYSHSTLLASNDYDCSAECVDGLAHPGNDLAYAIALPGAGQICATVNQSEIDWDAGLYLVTDCADVNGTCLAGASGWSAGQLDETFCSEPVAPGTYYIVVDGRSGDAYGDFRLDVEISCIAVPTDLTCQSGETQIELAWTNNDTYTQVLVYANDSLAATLSGTATGYSYTPREFGAYDFYVEAFKADGSHAASEICSAGWAPPASVILIPWEFPTIQAGIDFAQTGDTVLVADGTYTGPGNTDLDFLGKAITVRSQNGSEQCVIQCQGDEPGFYFHQGEDRDSILDGFTITGSQSAGIWCNAGPIIRNCLIQENACGIASWNSIRTPLVSHCHIRWNFNFSEHGGGINNFGPLSIVGCLIEQNSATAYGWWGEGGGLWSFDSYLTIIDSIFRGNVSDSYGGAISISDNHLERNGGARSSGERASLISGCVFEGNEVGGAIFSEYPLTVTNCLIAQNTGGGINTSYAGVTVLGSTITGNQSDGSGGGICALGASTVRDCIVWGNLPDDLAGGFSVDHSDVGGTWPGEGNLDAEPRFATGPEGGYYLSQIASGQPANSPCLDAGSRLAENICYTGASGSYCLDSLTTRSDHLLTDRGVVDMGYHRPVFPGLTVFDAGLACVPASGTLPFSTAMSVTFTSTYPPQARRIAASLAVVTAAGNVYDHWRSGYTNLPPGGTFQRSWNQSLPALATLVGANRFQLSALDVTPSPYNQPPYAPSGESHTDSWTVVGLAP